MIFVIFYIFQVYIVVFILYIVIMLDGFSILLPILFLRTGKITSDKKKTPIVYVFGHSLTCFKIYILPQ